ncbi:MAG: SpoIID/LytB domain-containing protein [Candidatus Riflebacteria bacterium]|nr:SpoIID/LytB domain-containing protein [Candidatus Riflebacteria bacterium]
MKPASTARGAIRLLVTVVAALPAFGPVQAGSKAAPSAGPFERFMVLSRPGGARTVMVGLPIRVAIGLAVEQQQVVVTGAGRFEARIGRTVVRARPGERWTVRRVAGRAARVEHLVVVQRFSPAEAAQAQRLVAGLRARGHDAGVVAVGLRLLIPGPASSARADGLGSQRILGDGRTVLVHVGRLASEARARERIDRLSAAGGRPWHHEFVAAPQDGVVALIGPDRRERGRARAVTFGSASPLVLLESGAGPDGSSRPRPPRSYEGAIHVVFDRKGLLATVNEINLERYLKGVVPAEIPASDPPQAIRALAVAARSEALAKLARGHGGQPFDLCWDQHCQAYAGLERVAPSTNVGVDATRGQVVQRGGSLVEAVYCDTCGGHTESIENVWSASPNPSLVGVLDGPSSRSSGQAPSESTLGRWLSTRPPAFCRGPESSPNPRYRWTVEMSGAQLDWLVNRSFPVGSVRELVPLERGVSGRIKLLGVVGDRGRTVIHKELPIRKALGDLMSALFVVDASRGADGRVVSWRFRGAGWGHGVGLCQVGSRWAARAGFGYRAILAHDYRGTTMARLYR